MNERIVPAGSDDAFTMLVLPELDVLLRVARTIVDRPVEADDLVQETLIRAYRSIGTFDGEHPRAWLFTIMRNALANQHRRRRPSLLHSQDDLINLATPAADRSIDAMYDGAIDAALGSLSARHRAVIELVDVKGLSYVEAAAALGVPTGTVMSRVSRARRKVRIRLVAEGFTVEGRTR